MFQDHLGNVEAPPDYSSVVNGTTVRGAVAVPNQSLKIVNAAFAQSIAPTPVLTASQAGIPNSLRYSQKTDFAPRVGFAWRVTADGKTVIRGGYGKFIEAPLGYLILSSWAVEASDVATFTNSISNGRALYQFPYPFPSNLAQPGTQDFDLSYALHYRDPYVQQWNFTIERDLGFQTGLRLSYDGSHGTDLDLTTNPDQVRPNTIGFAKASASAPFPLFDSLVNVENGGRSNYHALTVSLNKRMSKGLQFAVSYNFAKNLSPSSHTALERTFYTLVPCLEFAERCYDIAKFGEIPEELWLDCVTSSNADDSLAPPGNHILTCFVQYVPYRLRLGKWDENREMLGDRVVRKIAEYAPNVPGSIMARQVLTPLDLERTIRAHGGKHFSRRFTAGAVFLCDQCRGWSQYRTPIDGLYLCGAGAHPGGGVTGAPGHNAAHQALRDWKKGRFEEVRHEYEWYVPEVLTWSSSAPV